MPPLGLGVPSAGQRERSLGCGGGGACRFLQTPQKGASPSSSPGHGQGCPDPLSGSGGARKVPDGRALLWKLPRCHRFPSGPALGQSEGLVPTWLSQGLALRSRNPKAGDTGFPQVPAVPLGPSLVEDMLPLGTNHPQIRSKERGLFSLAMQCRSLNISDATTVCWTPGRKDE